MNDILAAHFQAIRIRIEASVKPHSIVMVTSATADDGARLTSFGLAECLAAAGHQTALVDARTNPAEAVDGRFKSSGRKEFPIYALPRDGNASARAGDILATFGRQTREAFDYTIIDAPPFGQERITVKLAHMVDVVLLSLRLGRQPNKADELLVRALDKAGAHILGIVGAEPASIAHFDQLTANEYVRDEPSRSSAASTSGVVIPHIRIEAH